MTLNEETKSKYLEAGKIANEVLKKAEDKIEPELKIIDLVKFVESSIKKKGGEIAFPCNVSVNNTAAHYTSPKDDEKTVKSGDYVKIDLGVHIEGYIADTATTVKVNHEKDDLMKAAETALEIAKKEIKPGKEVGKIGKTIEQKIRSYGFNPIQNLTGHKMEQWNLHTGVSLPNIESNSQYELKKGDVLAIEPFATNGDGKVIEGKESYIMNLEKNSSIRMNRAREITNYIKPRKSLPFAERWIYEEFSGGKTKIALKKMINRDIINPYRVLNEVSGGKVSQYEDTVIVSEDPIVTTD